jgi:diguanylate cyclase (GGDEF)-like protein/PAS domain S-box-containing protein
MDRAHFLQVSNAFPEALILVSSCGDVLAANNSAVRQLGIPKCPCNGTRLEQFVENTPEELQQLLKTWRRSRSAVPAPLKWASSTLREGNWRCEGFLSELASPDAPACVIVRCVAGKAHASQFIALNRELDRQRITLRKLQQSRDALEQEHEKAIVTLSSIGDAVITTDCKGVIEYLNPVAEKLTGWRNDEAAGQPLTGVFNIVNELTRKPAVNPVERCLERQAIVGLANHTALIAKDGTEYVIEDSAAPIRARHGGILGVVLVFRDVTDERLASRQLEYLAQHDILTGLKNRYFFEQQLKQAVQVAARGRVQHALLYIDMDKFKLVNDSAGHSAGDELLVELGRVLSGRLRQGDILARLGGDEFGILLDNVSGEQALTIAADYVGTMQGFRFTWDGESYDITPSIGVAIINQNTASTAEVMRQADIACYVCKGSGGNRYHLYDERDQAALSTLGELNLVRDIKDALAEDRFTLYFQPVVRVSDGAVQMYEVLLRMLDKSGGIVNPATFIPPAERYGLMPLLDQWVVSKVFSLLRRQRERDLCLTVNLSGCSLGDRDLMTLIQENLATLDLAPGALIFEVTETVAVGHLEKAGEFMRELTNMGCYFALDDFGTGFSSFAYLKHMPVRYVKIDGTFVKDIMIDPVDQAMVRSINQIAHSLGKETIAEFVESDDILEKLRLFGVDYAQGYGIGRPSPHID